MRLSLVNSIAARHILPVRLAGPSLACTLLLLATRCALQPVPRASERDISPTLTLSTYYEEGSQAAILVGTRPALSRRERAYIPIEISVANLGLAKMTLTPESFILVDSAGKSYPTVSASELSRGYGSTDSDRRLGELESVVDRRYPTLERVRSNFTPGFDAPFGTEELLLTRLSLLVDMVYFSNPEVPTPPGPYDLVVRIPEALDPLVVQFFIGRPKSTPAKSTGQEAPGSE